MAVAKAWSTGHTNHPLIPQLIPQLRPSSSSSINFTKKPLLKPSQNLHCCCTNANNNNNNNTDNNNSSTPSTGTDRDWKRWAHHFSEIEQAHFNVSLLIKFKLDNAIKKKEKYREPATLKTAFAEAKSKDNVHEIMSQVKDAINDERYHDASKLCQNTGSRLVGWWAGYSNDSDDPFSRIIPITPEVGRFVGKSYSPRQLFTASPRIPLFEIFVVKNGDDTYTMQVVYLRKNMGSIVATRSNAKLNENDLNIEKGIKSVKNYLTDIIPDIKLISMSIKISDLIKNNDSLNQLMENNEENFEEEEEDSDLDPFEGLFVGEFGPYGPQVIQLKRKYGNWDGNNEDGSVNSKLFEYVEAVKLTGDLQVPAGQVTFRAKIGKECLSDHRLSWPKKFGVVASYSGQGRIAESGFQNPKWVLGEFLHFNRKNKGGAFSGDLGFIYIVPNEQVFTVYLKRLKLPEKTE